MMINLKKESVEKTYLVLAFLLSSTISQIISVTTGVNNKLVQIVPLFIIVILININLLQNGYRFKVIHFAYVLIFTSLSLIAAIAHGQLHTLNMFFLLFLFPYILLIYKPNQIHYIVFFQKILNAFTILLLSWILIDFLFESRFQLLLANLLPKYSSLPEIIINENRYGIYRAHTFFGHSLYTTSLFLLFAVTNLINILNGAIVQTKLSKYPFLIPIIMSIGLIFTNSKFGLIIGAIINLIYVIYISKYKFISGLMAIIAFFIFLQSTFFLNNVWARFQQVLVSGDITNGRLSSFNALMESDFEFAFWGMGFEKNLYISYEFLKTGINFENPLLIYLIDFGVIYFLLVSYYMLIYVPFNIWKNMNKVSVLLYYLWISFVFSFNSIGLGASHLIFPLTSIFWFYIFSQFVVNQERVKL